MTKLLPFLLVALTTFACAEDEEPTQQCACVDGVCPDDTCDIRVTLAENCRGKLDTADVLLDGEVIGQATVDTPFASCDAFDCNSTVKLTVRSDAANFSTGEKDILTLLDPDVPIDCSNLP